MTKQHKQIIRFIAESVGWIAVIVITALDSIISGLITVIVMALIAITTLNPNFGKPKNAPKKRKKQDSQWQKDDEYDEWKEYEKSKRKLLEKYAKLSKENKDKNETTKS